MNSETIFKHSLKELLIIIISSLSITILMSYLSAYKRLYLFIQAHNFSAFDEFLVFFPAFLAMGFILLSYTKIQQLEAEVSKRREVETALLESKKTYKALSITDDLTQLYNVRYFNEILTMELERCLRYDCHLSLLLMDIDNFKHYNDTYTHLEGNKVLATMGEVIRQGSRKTDMNFRYGGEEFTVILPETNLEGAIVTAERIRTAFEKKTFSPKPDLNTHCTISIGVTQYKRKEPLNNFIKRADQAMYQAKNKGKNRVIFL
ncbi:MAG: diguanylate cyclase [Desulfobacterales bacterium]|nr:diguanylate cyclase [Desulfobacterales bacterium]